MATLDAAAFHDNSAHGDDSIAIEVIDGYVCAVVADGISMSGYGAVASQFAIETVRRTFRSVYGEREASIGRSFVNFVESTCYALQNTLPGTPWVGAETTLSIVVADPRETIIDERKSVNCSYFALGDSPIIVCRELQSPARLKSLSFLAHQIHNRPIVVEEEGRLYSFLDVSNGKIRGVPAIGSFRLFEGDICLVMTDGIPYDPHIIYDFGEKTGFRFLNTVTRKGAVAGVKWLKTFVAREALTDDGSLAILRYAPTKGSIFEEAVRTSPLVPRGLGPR